MRNVKCAAIDKGEVRNAAKASRLGYCDRLLAFIQEAKELKAQMMLRNVKRSIRYKMKYVRDFVLDRKLGDLSVGSLRDENGRKYDIMIFMYTPNLSNPTVNNMPPEILYWTYGDVTEGLARNSYDEYQLFEEHVDQLYRLNYKYEINNIYNLCRWYKECMRLIKKYKLDCEYYGYDPDKYAGAQEDGSKGAKKNK